MLSLYVFHNTIVVPTQGKTVFSPKCFYEQKRLSVVRVEGGTGDSPILTSCSTQYTPNIFPTFLQKKVDYSHGLSSVFFRHN